MTKKQKVALILNIFIFLLVVAGGVLCFGEIFFVETKALEHGWKLLKFFTVQSNLFAGVTSLLYVVFIIRQATTKKKLPIAIHILRYIATIDLIITFLVVALFLGFITDEGYFSLFVNSNLLFHFLIPVLNLVSFTFFENGTKLKFRHTFLALSHLFLYAVFYLTNVLIHLKKGTVYIDYDWYAFAQFGWLLTSAFAVILFGIALLIAIILYKINNRQNKEEKYLL